jgi:hypothetical protein
MDIWDIILIIIMLVVLTLVLYLAAGLASGDWSHSGGTWLRFILVAGISVILIPAFQSVANEVSAGDLALLIAFIIIMLLVRWLIVTELSVGDEWMTTIFTAFLAVFSLYIIEKIASWLFHYQIFSFIG